MSPKKPVLVLLTSCVMQGDEPWMTARKNQHNLNRPPHNVNSSCTQTIKQTMHERVSVTQFYAFLSRSNPIPNSFSSIRYSINTYPICFYPLKRSATGSFALLQKPHRNNPLLCVCVQQPYPVLFSCRHRSYPVECQHSRKFKINSHIEINKAIRNSAENCLFK